MEYQIRYTCSGELQQQIVEFISRNADKYIIAKEVASREHIQCYVVTKVTKKTWTNKFNEKFKGIDRRDKYVEPDKGTTKWYVCKGIARDIYVILAKRGFTDEEIQKLNHEYWDKNEEHNQSQKDETQISLKIEENLISLPEKKTQKEPKKKQVTFMTKVRNEILEAYPEKVFSHKDLQLIFMWVMRALGEGCRSMDKFIITRMVNGILNSLIKDDKHDWYAYWFQECFNKNYDYNFHTDNT